MARNTRCTKVESPDSASSARRAESSSISRSRASAPNATRICSITSVDIVIYPFRTPVPRRASAHDLLHYCQKLVRGKRFYDPGRRTCRLAFLLLLRMRFRGQQNDGDELVLRHRPKLARELKTVHLRHIDVAQEEVQFLALQFGQTVQAVHGFDNLIAAAPQHKAHHLPETGRIVHCHDGFHKPSRAPSNSRRRPQRSTAPMKASDGLSKESAGNALRSEYSSWRIQVSMSSKSPVSTPMGVPSSRPSPSLAARSWACRMVTAPSSFRICLPCLFAIENGTALFL